MFNRQPVKTIFVREPRQIGKLFFCLILSITFMIGDYQHHYLSQIRHRVNHHIFNLHWVINLPTQLVQQINHYLTSHHQLVKDNESLRQQQFLLKTHLQTFQALESENERLRELLNISKRSSDKLLLAHILQIDSDPFVHQILLDKGSDHNVYVGQPIIDEGGILGEIVEVNSLTSRGLLITDISYALPVEVLRTGTRAIVAGTSHINKLQLQYIVDSKTVKVGDQLITSGLGGRYPSGYPVGIVNNIIHEADEVFAKILVTPTAHLNRSREVLLLFPSKPLFPVRKLNINEKSL